MLATWHFAVSPLQLTLKCCVFILQLYIPWNYHERYPGQYTWDGMADVFSFIELIQELDMVVLLRVGPYICAEWDFGGLPWWLGSSQVLLTTCPQHLFVS